MSSHSWFTKALLPWYRAHHRSLPWRETRDPYRIWLSEVILQQTRVDQGLSYYLRFVERWPTVADLSAANENEVLKLWQGLGYYSRARNLLTAARQVMIEFNGTFPQEHKGLLQLKGVGDYTASAIASICFGKPEAVVDGNVYRVLARAFGIGTAIDSSAGKKQFKQLATSLIPRQHPGDHNQAVMELGATVCTPKAPDCLHCPISRECVAFATGTVRSLPFKKGKTSTRDRFFNYLHVSSEKGLYMRQRLDQDIWAGLFELPLIESEVPLTRRALKIWIERNYGPGFDIRGRRTMPRHVLSHQVIHAVFWSIDPPHGFAPPKEWIQIAMSKLTELAVPRLMERWMVDELEQKPAI